MDELQIEVKDKTYSFYRSVYAPVESNMYILLVADNALIFDSNISDEALRLLKEKSVSKVHLFLTHEHYDHSHGVKWLQDNFDTIVYCQQECRNNLSTKKRSSPRLVAYVLSVMDMKDGGHRYSDFKNSFSDYEIEPDVGFGDTAVYNIDGYRIQAIHTPGHTPGSSIYIVNDELVFTGDSMIQGNKIITGFRGGDKTKMKDVTLPILRSLDDELIVMPGHGEPFKKKEFNFDIYNV